ncbi:heavy-metal-associated domain-containing protein [Sphingomonas corticis]|jgi:hypothetical protein|uniref:Heavy-metal-associated domain-containing protein n=1 Tax=Sphingomonas corticis TaxID=2722791 RepID=A0ABX1CRN6_9SPHN|nr:heavy-metal-associated domain-containing protein [Sphingomonas corticis]NJR78970.1 heavy-metal-associated domain-containing protein [Sphingomonas corticis]
MRRAVIALLCTAFAGAAVMAQIEGGDRGVAAVDSSRDFEVSGIRVDTSGKDADAARLAGWREAQRRGWTQLSQRLGAGGGTLPDGVLDQLVSAIVVDEEQIGPTRYIARLGVLFDRQRAASLLGVSADVRRSPPMVVVPVVWSTGVGTAFEQRTAWQEAWARYRTGQSEVDYIRPAGNGPDPLLLNVGQTQRPDRAWWRMILDQYGGLDVVMPTVRLYRQWPGGPVIGVFQARHGPDNRLLSQFTLRVGAARGLPQMLDAGVARLDRLYQDALRGGYLGVDPGLTAPEAVPTPVATPTPGVDPFATDGVAASSTITVQFDSPDAAAVFATESAMRGVPGVARAATTSLALGGISLMQVGFAGSPEAFRAALEARGWQVFGTGTTIRVRRAPQLPPPSVQPDAQTTG